MDRESQPPPLPEPSDQTRRMRAYVESEVPPQVRREIARMTPHWSAHVTDRLGGMTGAICITILALNDKVSGSVAVGGIAALLGGLELLRRLGLRFGGIGAGGAGLVLVGLMFSPGLLALAATLGSLALTRRA